MIGGKEAIHAWTPPGADEPAIELNRVKDDAGVAVWPRIRITEIDGLMSSGDPQDVRDLPVGRSAEIARKSLRRGKSPIYTCRIEARSLLELRTFEEEIRTAFQDQIGEGRMDVFWHPLNNEFADAPSVFYEARVLACNILDRQAGGTWYRNLVIGFRQSDARHFETETGITAEATIVNSNTEYEIEP